MINIDELIKKEQERHKAKMEVYMEIKELESQKNTPPNNVPIQTISRGKPTPDDIISYATKIIREYPEMKKINKVINAMRNDGFEITKELANLMGQKVLLKSEKFRINKKTKFWEIIE